MYKRRTWFRLMALAVVSQALCACSPGQDAPNAGDDEAADAEGFFTSHEYDKAIPLLRDAIQKQAVNGMASQDLNYSKLQLGQCYARTGNYDEAQKYLSQCLPYVTLVQGECLEELGDVAVKKNQLTSAKSFYIDAIKWHEKKDDHAAVAMEKRKLAEVLELLKKNDAAPSP